MLKVKRTETSCTADKSLFETPAMEAGFTKG
jgi:hypothetical protein